MSLVAAALVWLLAYGDVRVVGRALLSFEGISVTLITIVVVVIFWKVIAHTAPNGQHFTLKPFVPASGTAVGAVASALIPHPALTRALAAAPEDHDRRGCTRRRGTAVRPCPVLQPPTLARVTRLQRKKQRLIGAVVLHPHPAGLA